MLSPFLDAPDSWADTSSRNSVSPNLPLNVGFLFTDWWSRVPFAAKLGTQVIIPYRDEDEARVFKPMGDLGQIVRMVRGPPCSGFRNGILDLFPSAGVGHSKRGPDC